MASVSRLVERVPPPSTVARLGLGVTLVLAGVHKLLAPAAWTVYVTDWLAPWLVVSPVAFMLANGIVEVGFGATLIADWRTALVAGVTAVSLTATAGYLAVVGVLEGGPFVDVFVRDVGLAALAWTVTLAAVRPAGAADDARG